MKNKKLFITFLIISILIFMFIMSSSMMDFKQTIMQSTGFKDFLKPVLPPSSVVDGSEATTPYYETNQFMEFIRKLFGHFGLFFGFSLFVNLTFFQTKLKVKHNIIYSFLVGVLTAISSELTQLIPEGRSPSVKDIFIDSFGYVLCIGIFMLIYYLIQKRMRKKGDRHEKEITDSSSSSTAI